MIEFDKHMMDSFNGLFPDKNQLIRDGVDINLREGYYLAGGNAAKKYFMPKFLEALNLQIDKDEQISILNVNYDKAMEALKGLGESSD